MKATVIIPFHRNLAQLSQSLPAARRALPDAEIVVVADGAVEDCRPLVDQAGARMIEVDGPSGPSVARNRAAAVATGEVLVFVDTDVVAAPDALRGLIGVLEAEPDVAAVFGAYDLEPPEPNFMSQYKNLSHACVHETGNPEAGTFWAGLGAVRAKAFWGVGGFDERFAKPAAEDIDLGYRIHRAGHRLRLDTRFRGRHLKHWSLWSSIVIDIHARGVPWTQLIYRYGAPKNDLNVRWELRLSVVLSYLLALSLPAVFFWPWPALATAVGSLALLVFLNRDYYGWFARVRGPWFATRVVPAHVLHHLCNGLSFVIGTAAYAGAKLGIRVPGALPTSQWTETAARGLQPARSDH